MRKKPFSFLTLLPQTAPTMYLQMSALLVCLVLVGAARGATGAKSLTLPGNTTEDEATRELDLMTNSPNNRQERLFSVFQIVQFNNSMCNASDGTMGVCFTAAECSLKGGVSTGSCAQGFGTCCVFKATTCGSTLSQLITYIQSPNYPNAAPAGMCMYTINKCDSSFCQFKVDFLSTVLTQPSLGDCRNDTLVISGVDAASQKIVPSPLCGTLNGQSIYLSVANNASFAKFTFNIVSAASNSNWLIKITQIPCGSSSLAPAGCLTYNTGLTGMITSFNNLNGAGSLINNECYTACIASQANYCDVALTATNFDLGTGDSISFGAQKFTGTTFGTANSLTWNYTGPYFIPVCLDATNDGLMTGFNIDYLLLPC